MKILFVILGIVLSFSKGAFAAQAGTDVVILDVRTDEEFAESHLKGALQIDYQASDFKEKISKLDKAKSYKIYCRSGRRSGHALAIMKDMGFKDLENVGGVKDASKALGIACEGRNPCQN